MDVPFSQTQPVGKVSIVMMSLHFYPHLLLLSVVGLRNEWSGEIIILEIIAFR